jgi:hypothetical protein
VIDLHFGGGVTYLSVGGGNLLAAHEPQLTERQQLAADGQTWVDGWPGGWHLLAPNAGAAAPRAVEPQGFHGNASWQPWRLVGHSQHVARIRWCDPAGLRIDRRLALGASGITVSTRMTNTSNRGRPVIPAEHLILGPEAAPPGTEVLINGAASLQQQGYDDGRVFGQPVPWHSEAAATWHVIPAQPTARAATLTGTGEQVELRSPTGSTVIRWSAEFRYLWLWQELAANTAPPWHGNVWAFGVEPASSPDGAGLDLAQESGTAILLERGCSMRWTASLTRKPS